MDNSSDKQAESHKRVLGHGYERENLKKKLIAAQNKAISTDYIPVNTMHYMDAN